eukprot:2126560-Pyramimonas_sp.AAC.2
MTSGQVRGLSVKVKQCPLKTSESDYHRIDTKNKFESRTAGAVQTPNMRKRAGRTTALVSVIGHSHT